MYHMASATANRKAEFKRKHKPRINNDGICLAAKRGMRAARAYLAGTFDTLKEAAEAHGTCVPYVESGIILVKFERLTGDWSLTWEVVHGWRSMLEAAEQAQTLVRLLDALELAPSATKDAFFTITGTADLSTPEKCLEYGKKIGPGRVWDLMVSPLVGIDSNGKDVHEPGVVGT